jgi:HEPN domain-containing protein
MDKEEIFKYWKDTSDKDYITMNNLFASKDYSWSLFIGHLVIEKLLKAVYIKNTEDINPPRIHDLLELAKRANIRVSEQQEDILDLLSTFNISARYPDYKQSFYLKCTVDYTNQRINEIKELRQWLISIIKK